MSEGREQAEDNKQPGGRRKARETGAKNPHRKTEHAEETNWDIETRLLRHENMPHTHTSTSRRADVSSGAWFASVQKTHKNQTYGKDVSDPPCSLMQARFRLLGRVEAELALGLDNVHAEALQLHRQVNLFLCSPAEVDLYIRRGWPHWLVGIDALQNRAELHGNSCARRHGTLTYNQSERTKYEGIVLR